MIDDYYHSFNERRFTDAAALFTDDAQIDMLPGHRQRGGVGYLRFAETWTAAFPDARLDPQKVVQLSGTLCEIHVLASGTHQGMLEFGAFRFPPSGLHAVLHVRELLQIRDGKIVATVVTFDLRELMNQLTTPDYDQLIKCVDRLWALRGALTHAQGDDQRRREIAQDVGTELDAARRALRPHLYQ